MPPTSLILINKGRKQKTNKRYSLRVFFTDLILKEICEANESKSS